MKLFQLFRITGVANTITYDAGLKSTAAEKKRLIAVHYQVDKHAGTDDNDCQGYHERAKIFDFPEKMIPDQLTADTTMDVAVPREMVIPVELDLPPGETFKAAMKCAATAVNARGVYEYEII